MDDFNERLTHLLHYPKITWKNVYTMLRKDPRLKSVYHLQPQDFDFTSFPPLNSFTKTSQHFQSETIHEQIRQYQMNDIKVISFFDKEYPPLLKNIYQPPWVLFAKGDLSLLSIEPKLAVVGSRQASQYGVNSLRHFIPPLIEKGMVIVSGLAKGIDTIAHETTIRHNGKTIAVIAGGFYHIYPKENLNLALKMMKTQLVISEYPPDTKPVKWQFPIRNRIISGLSVGTFIIEAKQKSGSLITANYALNEGREVFSLPGSIFNPLSNGTNELIQQGAKLVTKAEDIFEEVRL
ncbi:MAG TPA: DNA-processing protein DprA [Bacillales bacterium]|nr:DNA-processing protein DprA [Bacillales bacterium]